MRPVVWDTVRSNEVSFIFSHNLKRAEVWASSNLRSVRELTLQLNNAPAWLKSEYRCGPSSLWLIHSLEWKRHQNLMGFLTSKQMKPWSCGVFSVG